MPDKRDRWLLQIMLQCRMQQGRTAGSFMRARQTCCLCAHAPHTGVNARVNAELRQHNKGVQDA